MQASEVLLTYNNLRKSASPSTNATITDALLPSPIPSGPRAVMPLQSLSINRRYFPTYYRVPRLTSFHHSQNGPGPKSLETLLVLDLPPMSCADKPAGVVGFDPYHTPCFVLLEPW